MNSRDAQPFFFTSNDPRFQEARNSRQTECFLNARLNHIKRLIGRDMGEQLELFSQIRPPIWCIVSNHVKEQQQLQHRKGVMHNWSNGFLRIQRKYEFGSLLWLTQEQRLIFSGFVGQQFDSHWYFCSSFYSGCPETRHLLCIQWIWALPVYGSLPCLFWRSIRCLHLIRRHPHLRHRFQMTLTNFFFQHFPGNFNHIQDFFFMNLFLSISPGEFAPYSGFLLALIRRGFAPCNDYLLAPNLHLNAPGTLHLAVLPGDLTPRSGLPLSAPSHVAELLWGRLGVQWTM